MGRITVFSLDTCLHCRRAKGLLDDYGWEFTEISLSLFPEKRTDMLKLADRLTVPQIFFNNEHVGGAAELAALYDSDEIHQWYARMTAGPDPVALELQVPDHPPEVQPVAQARNEETICIGSQCYGYLALMVILEKELQEDGIIATRTYRGSEYKLCFVGSDFVAYLVARFELKTRSEAVQVGQSLCYSGLLHHVTNEHDLKDEYLFYRLHSHSDLKMLNRRRRWADRIDDPMVTVGAATDRFNEIKNRHTRDGLADYVAIAGDDRFPEFEDAVCEFQLVDLTAMAAPTRLAFVINLYNLIILHAFAKVGIPKSDLKRYRFYDQMGYEIGGAEFSLNDLENGILRGNQVPPAHMRRPFSATDPRFPTALPATDFRLHFALNCGARACPPIKKYSAAAIEEELQMSAMSFCEQSDNVKLMITTKTLWISMIFAWYAVDFGASKLEIARTVASCLRGQDKEILSAWIEESASKKKIPKMSFKIRHFPYDWTTDDLASASYKASTQTTNKSCALQ